MGWHFAVSGKLGEMPNKITWEKGVDCLLSPLFGFKTRGGHWGTYSKRFGASFGGFKLVLGWWGTRGGHWGTYSKRGSAGVVVGVTSFVGDFRMSAGFYNSTMLILKPRAAEGHS